MLQSVRRVLPAVHSVGGPCSRRWPICYSTLPVDRRHDPLRILFCGADDFSIHSLRRLHALQQQKPSEIESIDVLCKTDKPVERGLRKSQAVPVKLLASELGLRLHQIDTFTGWLVPTTYNLVVAVSFGLLVPARILYGCKYGGLNVHPSLLPDLRGSAPIVHTLLKGRKTTGVSLQTMHPTQFDHGTVLAQTEEVPVPSECIPDALLQRLGPLGADLLCRGIDNAVFVPPLQNVREGSFDPPQIDLAPKITPEDRHIDWSTWKAGEILLRDRVLGDLWDTQTFSRCHSLNVKNGSESKRVTFHGPWARAEGDKEQNGDSLGGEPELIPRPFRKGRTLGIRTKDNCIVIPASATIEGKGKGTGLQALTEQLRRCRKFSP